MSQSLFSYAYNMLPEAFYNVGDELILTIKEDIGDNDFMKRHIKVLIIGEMAESYGGDYQYLCYVPPYELHPYAERLTKNTCNKFFADMAYLREPCVIINNWTDVHKHIKKNPGTICDACREFVIYAERDSNNKFTCWSCKNNPYGRTY